MSLTEYLLFTMIAATQAGSPSPSTIFLVNNVLIYSPGRVILIYTGNLLAVAVLASCSLLGIGSLLLANPNILTLIKFAGAIYLLWLGLHILLIVKSNRVGCAPQVTGERIPVLWGRSFMAGISKPKKILFFSSLLPQFVENPQSLQVGNLFSLVLLFVLVKLLASSVYVLTAGKVAGRLAAPSVAIWSKRASGGVIIISGVVMGISAFE
ncbi:LysE family translocator [Pseudomonas sp.]|uniref:LysE family translocator n=1 Tax=Pseudomonas sp. TaxID=306 RepID=UPI002C029CF1|nr:LysE family transporter [Pseudomonas sp.]HUE90532.1 LysE family transporter [Pseudomonas sp.]